MLNNKIFINTKTIIMIPTAEEFAESNQYNLEYHDEGGCQGIDTKIFAEKLIEFAKLHCAEQVKVISERVVTKVVATGIGIHIDIDKESILNAYSLDNIK